ncbi:hypothetical protein BDQ17DRAFT_1388604 [Cyathus striatus]|nr:hypothetical protein BDQ17DRAFT_1388604 [Cyathus striatus]
MTSLLSNTKSLWRKHAPSPISTEPITLAVVGCGQRGKAYATYALASPTLCKVVAIAEPRPKTQQHFAHLHNVDNTLTIATVGKRLADAVVIAVQDHEHLDVALAFAEQGYHILCEKPMATTLEDCLRMESAVKKAGIIFGMGHVLRYSPYNKELTSIVRSGDLGELVNIVHMEPVGYYHFAHSYVRGNWSSEKKSSFSLMTKSCHDIDILCHWLAPATPTRVSSFGSLKHFCKAAKPKAAGDATRCLDCCIEAECPYSAKKIYLEPVSNGKVGWPAETLVDGVPDIENIAEALMNGPYGKCVYESTNDVCDHQVVNLEFSNGSTVSFTMVAYTSAICERQTRMHFTHGEIIGDMNTFTVTNFRRGTSAIHRPLNEGGGHGGGDSGLIKAFIEAVRTGRQEELDTTVEEVLKSHLTVFAAEASRKEGKIVDCANFESTARDRLNRFSNTS